MKIDFSIDNVTVTEGVPEIFDEAAIDVSASVGCMHKVFSACGMVKMLDGRCAMYRITDGDYHGNSCDIVVADGSPVACGLVELAPANGCFNYEED